MWQNGEGFKFNLKLIIKRPEKVCWILSLFKHLVASGFLMCLFYPPRPKDLMQKMLFFFQLTDSVLGLCLPPTAASHRHGPWRQCSQVHTVRRRSRLHLHHWSTDWRHSRTGGAGQVGDHCYSQTPGEMSTKDVLKMWYIVLPVSCTM